MKKKQKNNMSETSDFFYLGKVVKTHGIHGELSGFVDADDPLVYSQLHGVFIRTKQGIIPHLIESINIDDKGYFILCIEGVDSIEKAKKFIGKEMYLPLSMLPPLGGNNFYFHEIIGFSVVDSISGHLGEVTGVLEHTRQPLMEINHNGTEILIPIHDDIITKVDRDSSTIYITAPEGLIDVYLNS